MDLKLWMMKENQWIGREEAIALVFHKIWMPSRNGAVFC